MTADCTVAIPVYNRKNMVMRAVESALKQQVAGLEVLVVDNCSTDGTWELLQDVTDPRLRLVRNERNVGLFGNFNRCLDLARGRYLRFLCSDDALTDDCLEHEIAALDAHPSAALVTTAARLVDSDGAVLGTHADHLPPGVYRGRDSIAGILAFKARYGYNPLNYPSGILLRTATTHLAGHFDSSMKMAADVDLFLRVLSIGDLVVLGETGCEITIHRKQEGARLAATPVVMEEEFAQLQRFAGFVGAPEELASRVHELGGLCVLIALRRLIHRDRSGAREHLVLARTHGARFPGTVAALLAMLGRRFLVKSTGVRLQSGCFRYRPIQRVEAFRPAGR